MEFFVIAILVLVWSIYFKVKKLDEKVDSLRRMITPKQIDEWQADKKDYDNE